MGKHRHKKSFYDVDEDELRSSERDRHHRRRRRRHSSEKQDETKQRVPSMAASFPDKIDNDDDEVALQSPPGKRHRSSSNIVQSPSRVLSQLIENPEFLASAGPKAKEFAETAKQLLAKPDLDPTTQQIICAMAQAAVNVGKRLSTSTSSTPADQCVDEISITNSTTYTSSALLSPTLSNTSSSSTSTTPQQHQSQGVRSREGSKTPTEPESDEDMLIKQMIERAMKLTQQGDTRHAQHLLGVIHEKLPNKRKRAAAAAAAAVTGTATCTVDNHDNERPKAPPSNDFYALPSMPDEELQYAYDNYSSMASHDSEQPISGLQNDEANAPCFSYPPPPPPTLPPPPPPPPMPDACSTAPTSVTVPPMEQVQELLSNPSEVQDILKKLFAPNETPKVLPPEEYQLQSHLAAPALYYSQTSSPLINSSFHPSSFRSNNHSQTLRRLPSSIANSSQPYNSSLAFMQGNRRNLPPLQTPERCFSSSSSKTSKPPASTNRSFSFSSSTPVAHHGIMPLLASSAVSAPLSAPPLMKIHPSYPLTSPTSAPFEAGSAPWPNTIEQQRGFHPFWCATCAVGSPHQLAYQEHLRSHVACHVPGCSYTASEQLVRLHYQNIHENNARNRMTSTARAPQSLLEAPWPLMRM